MPENPQQRTGQSRKEPGMLAHEPTQDKRLDDGSTHTTQALTDAGEACVQGACRHALEEQRLRKERYSLRTSVENILDEVSDMASDEQITAGAADVLRQMLRDALGLDQPLT